MERIAFSWSENFSGDWELFSRIFANPYTNIVYDIDGILINSPKKVLQVFATRTGIKTNPADIDEWNYLTQLAKKGGLSGGMIESAEKDWYDADVLKTSQRYLWIKPVVDKSIQTFGPERNFVLTSREPELTDMTNESIKRLFPNIWPGNILIRARKSQKPTEFKAHELEKLSKHAPWVVLIEDSVKYAKAAIEANIYNCFVINVPLGKIVPDFCHDRMAVVGRYPVEIQAMYPLWHAIEMATRKQI